MAQLPAPDPSIDPTAAPEIISTVFGAGMVDDVAELARRRLATAIHAAEHGYHDPGFTQMALQAAVNEYVMVGGNPDDVTGDWVRAWDDRLLWRPVPAEHATWDAATQRWLSTWTDQ